MTDLTHPRYSRALNEKQHDCLDRIAKADPAAFVHGWLDGDNGRGPIVWAGDGSLTFVATTGRQRKLV